MVACARGADQRQCDRGQSGGNGQGRVRAFELRVRRLQVDNRRQSMEPIGQARILAAFRRLEIGDRVEKNGGRTIDRRVDGTDVLVWIAAEVRDRRRRFDVRFVVHAVERRLAAICATCTATDWRMSMTSASRGSSSVAN